MTRRASGPLRQLVICLTSDVLIVSRCAGIVNGTATLNNDPVLLEQLSARGKPSLLCTEVSVEECFFHCGKAMIRSRAWDPDSWSIDGDSLMVAQVVDALGGDPALLPVVNAQVEKNYIDDL